MAHTGRTPSPDPRFAPPSPFSRLVAAHAASVAGDGCFVASLAGSLFFSQPTNEARAKVLLYLALTSAPFALIAPLLGPALDRRRGGRRLLLVLSIAGRMVLALLVARYITRSEPAGLLVYPLSFGVLVLQKTYGVAKSALLPAVVADDAALVRANSRLNIVSTVAGAVGALPAYGVHAMLGSEWSLVLAAAVFLVAGFLALKIPAVETHQTRAQQRLEREELHQPSVLLAGSATAVLRGAVGYLAWLTAFALKGDKLALGTALLLYGLGVFTGNVLAPTLRQRGREEALLATSMVSAAVLVALGSAAGSTFGFVVALGGLGVGASAGKLAFDSLLQRDGPDAVRGRAFARYETRFQLSWVVGGLIGLVPMSGELGLLLLALVLLFGASSYGLALQTARRRGVYRTRLLPEAVDRALRGAGADAVSRVTGRLRSRRRRPSPRAAPPSDDPDHLPPGA